MKEAVEELVIHPRKRNLTEHDIEAILHAFEDRVAQKHICRFTAITEEEFYESVKFFKFWNDAMSSGKNLAAKTILVLLITLVFSLLGYGIAGKIKG